MAIEIFGLLIAFDNKKREYYVELQINPDLQLQINPLSPFLEETRGTNFYPFTFFKGRRQHSLFTIRELFMKRFPNLILSTCVVLYFKDSCCRHYR